MILVSASRRTDIAALYSAWFLNRIKEGYCDWRNPFSGQIKRVSLVPEDLIGIVFWTRHPLPLMPHLAQLSRSGHYFYFQFTITGYDRRLDTHGPDPGKAVDVFRKLAGQLSPALVWWRYDPIILSDQTPASYHQETFAALARKLAGFTERCTFSFVDWYGKTKRNLAAAARTHGISFEQPDLETRRALVRDLDAIARPHGIRLYSCCEDALLETGVGKAHCVDLEPFRALRPELLVSLRSAPSRTGCGCVESVDIGAYDTCVFGCLYCYATNSRRAALARRTAHDPRRPFLFR